MNINLVYEGKDYNFDIPNGVTIDYLKELSSKIFNSEKELLDLVYNNEKFPNNNDNTLIRDLIPEGETNAVLTVQINRNLKNKPKDNSNKITPLVNLKQKNIESTIKEEVENITSENNKSDIRNQKKKKTEIKSQKHKKEKEIKIFDNQTLNGKENKTNNNNFKTNINNNKQNINGNKMRLVFNGVGEKIANNNFNSNLMEKEISKKILFESTYLKKNNELLALIKEFNERIKKIYLILYKKYRNSGLASNNISSFSSNNTSRSTINLSINSNYFYELSLYERKIINFQEKQIQFYKSLLDMMKKYDNTISFNKLTEFYNKLIIFNLIDNAEIKFEQIKPIKLTKVPSTKLVNSNSSINLSTLNSINNTNKLPFINNKNINSPLIKDNNRNNITNNTNKINNVNPINNISFKQINENKENKKNLKNNIINNNGTDLKNSKLKKSAYNDDNNILSPSCNLSNNLIINNTNYKNNSNNNLINNKDIVSEKSSDESNNDIKNNNLNSSKLFSNSVNKNINNNITPIQIYRRDSISNFKMKKIPDRYNNEKENGNNIFYDDKTKAYSKMVNRIKNTMDKKIIIEDFRKNDNSVGNKLKKDKKIKDINVSNMTINDSNFAREKHFSPKKSKKNSINKYDFLV